MCSRIKDDTQALMQLLSNEYCRAEIISLLIAETAISIDG